MSATIDTNPRIAIRSTRMVVSITLALGASAFTIKHDGKAIHAQSFTASYDLEDGEMTWTAAGLAVKANGQVGTQYRTGFYVPEGYIPATCRIMVRDEIKATLRHAAALAKAL